jgi:DNA repair protein RadC
LAGHGDELSDADLLALIWGSGIPGRSAIELAQELLASNGGLVGLVGIELQDLASFPGIGPAKASQLWAAVELSRRTMRGPAKPRLHSTQAAAGYLIQRCQGWTEERFGLLALNSRCTLLADRILSLGTANATLISPREFFREALKFGAVSTIAFHNHPTGEVQPSREDIRLTQRLREAGGSLGVPLVDHLIIGKDRYFSFRNSEEWREVSPPPPSRWKP